MTYPAVFLRLPTWLDDALRTRSEEMGVSRQEYVRSLLAASLIGPKGKP